MLISRGIVIIFTVLLGQRGSALVEHASKDHETAKPDTHTAGWPLGKVNRHNRSAHKIDFRCGTNHGAVPFLPSEPVVVVAQDYVLLTASASARELGFLVPPSDATKGRIPLSLSGEFLLPPWGDWKISPPLLRQELRRGLTLDRYMEPDAADITPAGCQPNRSKRGAESAPLDAQSKIDSIVLNVPVADVYAHCSRFEELPRFITSLRDVQKIDETHFSFTSMLDGQEYRTVVQIVLRIPERRIAWQAMPDNFPRGVVLFEPLSNRTTEITVRLRSSIESATLAKVTRDYLTNFKRALERTSMP